MGMMDSPTQDPIEKLLVQAGRDFIYPNTPDVVGQVARRMSRPARAQPVWRRRLAWSAAIILLILAALWAVPPVRAQILQFLQFGAVRIFLSTPTPTSTLAPTQTAIPGTKTPPPTLTPSPLPSLLDLGGETTLAQAQQSLKFPILLPTYPADLGPPDNVYLQDLGGPTIILAWLQPDHRDQVRMSLIAFGPGSFAGKYAPDTMTSTTVNGQDALWLQGNHALILQRRDSSTGNVELIVNANVLLWMDGEITYRLETSLPLDEARRVAESLKPASGSPK
jgi:hypothetical protein